MQKIPTLFRRDPDNMRHVLPEVTEGCEWVLADEGTPTRKYDGTCLLYAPPERDHTPEEGWFARREVKAGKEPPANWWLVDHDETTGKSVGWEPITQSPFVKFWREAIDTALILPTGWEVGTYELIGPKINGNPEGPQSHCLVLHADAEPIDVTYPSYEGIRKMLTDPAFTYEGIVWHHPDGRMAKIKVRDFT